MQACSQCGRIFGVRDQFCANCGSGKPVYARNCLFCKKPLSAKHQYCPHCGREQAYAYQEYVDPLESTVEKLKSGGAALKGFSDEKLSRGRAALQDSSQNIKKRTRRANPLARMKRGFTRAIIIFLLVLVVLLGLAVYLLLNLRGAI